MLKCVSVLKQAQNLRQIKWDRKCKFLRATVKSFILMHPPFPPICTQMAAIYARMKKSVFLTGVIKVHSDFNWFQGPAVLLSCTNKLDGTFLFLGVHSSDKEKIIFPLLQMRKQKVKEVDQGHKHERTSFLESQWSLTRTGDCSLCLCAALCNYSTAVFALQPRN